MVKFKVKNNKLEKVKEAYNNKNRYYVNGEIDGQEHNFYSTNDLEEAKKVLGEIYNLNLSGNYFIGDKDEQREVLTECNLTESVSGNYFDKFSDVEDEYLPDRGEGDTMASQIVTAVVKLIYKGYNDGDVFDNTAYLGGGANDLSSYANWLDRYVPETSKILDKIFDSSTEDDYEKLLKELADLTLNKEFLSKHDKPKSGTIYDCGGPFQFQEFEEDEEDFEESLNEADQLELSYDLHIILDKDTRKDENKIVHNLNKDRLKARIQRYMKDPNVIGLYAVKLNKHMNGIKASIEEEEVFDAYRNLDGWDIITDTFNIVK